MMSPYSPSDTAYLAKISYFGTLLKEHGVWHQLMEEGRTEGWCAEHIKQIIKIFDQDPPSESYDLYSALAENPNNIRTLSAFLRADEPCEEECKFDDKDFLIFKGMSTPYFRAAVRKALNKTSVETLSYSKSNGMKIIAGRNNCLLSPLKNEECSLERLEDSSRLNPHDPRSNPDRASAYYSHKNKELLVSEFFCSEDTMDETPFTPLSILKGKWKLSSEIDLSIEHEIIHHIDYSLKDKTGRYIHEAPAFNKALALDIQRLNGVRAARAMGYGPYIKNPDAYESDYDRDKDTTYGLLELTAELGAIVKTSSWTPHKQTMLPDFSGTATFMERFLTDFDFAYKMGLKSLMLFKDHVHKEGPSPSAHKIQNKFIVRSWFQSLRTTCLHKDDIQDWYDLSPSEVVANIVTDMLIQSSLSKTSPQDKALLKFALNQKELWAVWKQDHEKGDHSSLWYKGFYNNRPDIMKQAEDHGLSLNVKLASPTMSGATTWAEYVLEQMKFNYDKPFFFRAETFETAALAIKQAKLGPTKIDPSNPDSPTFDSWIEDKRAFFGLTATKPDKNKPSSKPELDSSHL